jgi:hypothetical protein
VMVLPKDKFEWTIEYTRTHLFFSLLLIVCPKPISETKYLAWKKGSVVLCGKLFT